METSAAKELLGLLSEHTGKWQNLWTTFYTVAAATLTLIASGKVDAEHIWAIAPIASAMFLIFAAGNYQALESMRQQRGALLEFMSEKAADSPHLLAVVTAAAPPSRNNLRVYHWGLSSLIVALLWVLPLLFSPEIKG
jgi:hypothetical protein